MLKFNLIWFYQFSGGIMNFCKIFGVIAVIVVTFVFAERTKEAKIFEEQTRLKHTAEVRPELAGKMAESVLKEIKKSEKANEAKIDIKALEKIIKGGNIESKNLDNALRLYGNLAGRLDLNTSVTTRDPELAKLIKANETQDKAIQAKVDADMRMYTKLSSQVEAVGKNFENQAIAKKLQLGMEHTMLTSKGEQSTQELLKTSESLLRKLSTDKPGQAEKDTLFLLEKALSLPASKGIKARVGNMLKGAGYLLGFKGNEQQANAATAAKAYTTVAEEYAKGLLTAFRELDGVKGKDIKAMTSEEVFKELSVLELKLIENGKLNDEVMQKLENKAMDALDKYLMEKLGIKSKEELEKVKKECCLMAPCSTSGLTGAPAGNNLRNLAPGNDGH